MRKMNIGNAKGFTLIEMLIVIILLGIVILIVASNLVGNTAGARAKALMRVAGAAAQNMNMLALECGTTTVVAGNTVLASGKTMADVVFEGRTAVAAAKQQCYDRSSVRALRDGVSRNGNIWDVNGYQITLAGGGGNNKIQVSFAGVPDEVVLMAAQTYNSGLTALAASDTTGDVVRYGAASGGLRTVTFLLD